MGELFDNKCLYFRDEDNQYKPLGLPSEARYTNEAMKIPKFNIEIDFPENVEEYFMNEEENTNKLKENKSKELKVLLPERYIINENATILFWKNGEKTVVKRSDDDKFNPRLAFLTAFFQHYVDMSKNKANKYLASLQVEVKEIKQNPKHMVNETKKLKFKIGDRVEVIKADIYSQKGWKGKIVGIDAGETVDKIQVLVNYDNGQEWWIYENQIKLIKEEK